VGGIGGVTIEWFRSEDKASAYDPKFAIAYTRWVMPSRMTIGFEL
jgi:hypothetical protein